MVDWSSNIDFNKYHSFFLAFYKSNDNREIHMVRPCTATYDDIENRRITSLTLESAILSFTKDTSLSEIILECSIRGISLDFIDIYVKNDNADKWHNEYKIFQTIDAHKEDIAKYIEEIEAPRHYVVKNKNHKDVLKFLVIDRFSQDNGIEFLKGQYNKNAVIAGFNDYKAALAYCGKLNLT